MLDLSMSVAPHPLKVPAMPASVWSEADYWREQFILSALKHYQCNSIFAVTGVEAGVSALARLFQTCYGSMRVVLAEPYFDQWALRFRRAGHIVLEWPAEQVMAGDFPDCDVVVLGRPVNPTGQLIGLDKARELAEYLRGQGGWLILDEAYIDCTGQPSYTPYIADSPAIVLRALGPFTGLMGSNMACICSDAKVGRALEFEVGANAVSAAQWWLGCHVFDQSKSWYKSQRKRIHEGATRLSNLWSAYLPNDIEVSHPGFWVCFQYPDAADLQFALETKGVFLRRYHGVDNDIIRCAIPSTETQWAKLEQALQSVFDVAKVES